MTDGHEPRRREIFSSALLMSGGKVLLGFRIFMQVSICSQIRKLWTCLRMIFYNPLAVKCKLGLLGGSLIPPFAFLGKWVHLKI